MEDPIVDFDPGPRRRRRIVHRPRTRAEKRRQRLKSLLDMPRLTRQQRNQRLALLAVFLVFVIVMIVLPVVNYFASGGAGHPANSNLDRANTFRAAPKK